MSTLDPVQIAALDFARDKPGVGWFMEQGLGKTLTALAEYSWYHELDDADRMIVVCPNTFKKGWTDEIEKHGFSFTSHIFQSVHKDKASRFVSTRHNSPPVLVVNYEAIRRPNVIKALCIWAQRGKTYLAVDESIQIKGNKSEQTKAVHKLAPLCAFQRILTGRPQTQGPQDLWGQLRTIGLLPGINYYAFRNHFCIMGGYMMKSVVGVRFPEELAALMEPYVFQAKKKDWLPDLPRKAPTIREYKMSGEQAAQYKSMEEEFLLWVEDAGAYVSVDIAIAKYEKLAQIQTGFIYDDAGDARELVDPSNNPRLNLLKELIENEVTGKCCIVYRHRPIYDLLVKALAHGNPAWIRGGMKPDEVEIQKARFNNDPDCRFILLQAEASKYGHTLLAGPAEEDKCRTMIFFENSYTADTRDQVEDRIHRRGQTGEYVLYIDMSGSDLDRRIVKALQAKDALYRSVFKNLKASAPANV